MLLGGVLSAVTHVELVVHVGETVLDQTILHLDVAKRWEAARARHVVGNSRHIFHTTCNLRLGESKLNVLSSEDNGLEARSTDFVDGDGLY
jgi:hypothetical protein